MGDRNVSLMLPMSVQCNTCGNNIYKGTRFNSRIEDVIGEVTELHFTFDLIAFLLYLSV